MKRGFKAYTERKSLSARSELGLQRYEPIDPWQYVRSKGIILWTPEEVPGVDPTHVSQLVVRDPNSWSGITVREGETIAIIVNSAHPKARIANTIMHEWAHIELKHKPNRVDQFDGGIMLLSDYPEEIEDEANWLAGAMLVPREGLVHWRKKGFETEKIAELYGVSEQLVTWRRRMTGVDRQIGR